MRNISFANREFYHVYNRGIEKRNIFLDDGDRYRFLRTLQICNTPTPNSQSVKRSTEPDKSNALVLIHTYCLMDNHFHMIIEQIHDSGVSKFMQRIGNSYTKYFNIKNERSGRLFQSVYQAQHIDSDSYLGYLQAYIHTNPSELPGIDTWSNLQNYPWSSLNMYLNKTNSFITQSKISSLYSNQEELKKYIRTHYQHLGLERMSKEKFV